MKHEVKRTKVARTDTLTFCEPFPFIGRGYLGLCTCHPGQKYCSLDEVLREFDSGSFVAMFAGSGPEFSELLICVQLGRLRS